MAKPLRIKIKGTVTEPGALEIIDVATGEALTNVLSADIHLERSPADCHVTLTIWGAEIDIEANVDAVKGAT
jgi:hypothetical protein